MNIWGRERDSAEGSGIRMVLGNCTVLASDTQMWNSWMFSLKELCKNGSAIFLPPFRQANWKRKKIEWFWPSFKEQEFCFHRSFRFQKLILFWIAMKPADSEILCKGEFLKKLQCISSGLTGFVVMETETLCFDFLKVILCYSKKANTK